MYIHCTHTHTHTVSSGTHSVVIDNVIRFATVQHFLVPLHQPLGLGDFLLRGVAVENVVIPLARGAGPNVSCEKPVETREGVS